MEQPKEFIIIEIKDGHLFIDSNAPPIIIIGYLEKLKFDLMAEKIKFDIIEEPKTETGPTVN